MSDETAAVTRSKEEIAALRPLTFLRGVGPVDESGKPRSDLMGDFTTAACMNFEAGELSPQELAYVYEAIKQILPTVDAKTAGERFATAVDQAFDTIANMIRQEINQSLQDWIQEWFPLMENDACIDAFMQHMAATISQYTIMISLKG